MKRFITGFVFIFCAQLATAQQWLGSSNAYGTIYRAGAVKAGYGPLYLDWTYQQNWGGSAYQWAGHVGFNAFRYNNDAVDRFYGDNPYTSKGVFEGSNHGFRWMFRAVGNNDSDQQHLLPELMRLTPGGFLGIGTTSPDAKLTVKGTIHAEEVKVDLSVPWPDYVFEKDYPLTSLSELKSYIEQNKHLPEIPSAKEMEENGINLKEMNLLLLKKVEELTLYLIEQKTEITELKSNDEKLKMRITSLEAGVINKN